jgi:hypothetical protein
MMQMHTYDGKLVQGVEFLYPEDVAFLDGNGILIEMLWDN